MSNKREREKRREERLQQEAKVDSGERRTKLLQLAAGAVFLAIVAVVDPDRRQLRRSERRRRREPAGSGRDRLAGRQRIPRTGLTLGKPSAKVELIEYGDLQCPVCKAYAEEILPQVIENKVDSGEAKISFHNFTIIGTQSAPAGAAALAAGEQRPRLELHRALLPQPGHRELRATPTTSSSKRWPKAPASKTSPSGKATARAPRSPAKSGSRPKKRSGSASKGTPSFAIKGPETNGLELLGNPGSAEEIEAAIDSAS